MKLVELINKLQSLENEFGSETEVLLFPPLSDPDDDPYAIAEASFMELAEEDREKEWVNGSTDAGFVILYPYE